jgi:RNA polymerase sigma-70 factor (ECF subfamily)
MNDLQAIQRLKDGDIGGLELLVARYQSKAVRTAFLITHDEGLAEDAVQDAFLKIHRHIRTFDLSRPFEPYLLRSVIHSALDITQKVDADLSLEGDLDQVEGLLSQAVSVESEVEYLQLKQRIMQALASLEPRQRAVVVQRYYLDMSEKEMAAMLETPPGTVKWLLNTARTRLRELLGSGRSAE